MRRSEERRAGVANISEKISEARPRLLGHVCGETDRASSRIRFLPVQTQPTWPLRGRRLIAPRRPRSNKCNTFETLFGLTGCPRISSAEIIYHHPLNHCRRSILCKKRCKLVSIAGRNRAPRNADERNHFRKRAFFTSPQSKYINVAAFFASVPGTVNTGEICVAITIVRANRCTQVTVTAFIEY